MTPAVRMRLLLAVLLGVLAVSAPASADAPTPLLGAAGRADAGPPAEAHGWLVLRRPDAEGALLVHLPPRRGAAHGESGGVARRARALDTMPDAVAASGRRVFLFYDTPAPGPNDTEPNIRVRRVLAVEATPTPLDGVWTDLPEGRFQPLAPLPPDGEVIGFAAAEGQPVALLRTARGLRMLTLERNQWVGLPVPAGADPDAAPVLLTGHDALALLLRGPEPAIALRSPGDEWAAEPLALPPAALPLGLWRGRVVAFAPGDGDGPGRLVLVGSAGVQTLAELDLPAPAVTEGLGAVVIPDESGRLVLVWSEPAPTDARDPEPGFAFRIREISLSTGRTLFDGPVQQVMPVSAEEFRLLAVVLVVVLVVSLFVVLRPGGEGRAIVLPEGTALATPGRRLLATGLDVAFCAILISAFTGVAVGDILSFRVLINPGNEWVTLPGLVAVGLIYGTLAESISGATIGKLLLGCRAVRGVGPAGPGFIRLTPAQAFVRNLIKWVLPPVAALAVLDPSGRHRGDMLAGAVVVVRAFPPADESDT